MNPAVDSEMLDGAAAWWADWMFQMTWQVSILVIVLTAATYVLRRRSAVFLHALWILVLVRLVIPPAFAFPTGWGWWLDPTHIPMAVWHPHAAIPVAEKPAPGLGESDQSSPSTKVATSPPLVDSLPAEFTALSESTDSNLADSRRHPGSAGAAGTAGFSHSWAIYLLLAWAGVSGTLLAMLGLGSLRVGRWVREATLLTDPALCDMLHDCCERLEVGSGIELRNSETCTTPVVVGHFQPVILLPAAVLRELDQAELRSVLIHELQHIRRGDAICNFFQGVLGAVYFFHPLVWWANRRIRELREDACDELTVAALQGVRKPYGSALLKVTELFGYASPPLALGVMETKHPAHRRLQRILDPKLPAGESLGWGSLGAILIFAALLLPAGAGQTKPHTLVVATATNLSNNSLIGHNSTGELPSLPAPIDTKRKPSENAASGHSTVEPMNTSSATLAADLKPNSITALPSLALRYRWEQGQSYSYSLRIEADDEDQVEMFSGTITYTVRSTDRAGSDLAFDGRLVPSRRIKSPARGFAAGPPRYSSFTPYTALVSSRTPTEHVLRVDDQGHVQSSYGDLQLPYMLGNLAKIMLVPLSGEDEKWESTGKTTIQLHTESRFPRRPFGPFSEGDDATRLEATELTTLSREKQEGELMTLRKQYELKSTETHDGRPKVELTSGGTVVFDRRRGLPVSLEVIAALNRSDVNFAKRTPLRISGRLLSEADVEKQREDQQQAQEVKPFAPASPGRPAE